MININEESIVNSIKNEIDENKKVILVNKLKEKYNALPVFALLKIMKKGFVFKDKDMKRIIEKGRVEMEISLKEFDMSKDKSSFRDFYYNQFIKL